MWRRLCLVLGNDESDDDCGFDYGLDDPDDACEFHSFHAGEYGEGGAGESACEDVDGGDLDEGCYGWSVEPCGCYVAGYEGGDEEEY